MGGNLRAEQFQGNPKMPGVCEYGRHGGEDGRINGAKMWKILTIKKGVKFILWTVERH